MNHTQNLHLPQFAASDRIMHDDFNDAFSKIDAGVAANTAALALKGNCRIEVQTYTGTGTYGENNPTRITFPRRPVMAFVCGSYAFLAIYSANHYPLAWWSDPGGVSDIDYSWDGNTVSIVQSAGANFQFNESGAPYTVIGFYAAEN